MPPKERNQYIPKYIKDVPLFLQNDDNIEQTIKDDSKDYLSHHRNGEMEGVLNSEPKIGQGIKDEFIIGQESVIPSRKLKGRCRNCGSGNHDTKDCLEKPKMRCKNDDVENRGVKGKRNDDVDYDGKRDRWFGYDVNDYNKYLSNWKAKPQAEDEEEREFDTDEEIELKELGLWEDYTKDSAKKKDNDKTVRLREDKAVYLKDFKNNEITYDPKSRMIRDETTGYYNEDNLFVRNKTGDALKFEQIEKRTAWESDRAKNKEDKIMLNPTLMDLKMNKKATETSEKGLAMKNSLMDKYNNKDDQDDDLDEVPRSRFDEDVLINGHTSVFGSFYSKGKWGFKCCKQTDPNSICGK